MAIETAENQGASVKHGIQFDILLANSRSQYIVLEYNLITITRTKRSST